ncbi:hypothetical protein EK904_009018 [Melospiza melodia maxima]|nr:hypothetical protein EK904_009018 [Melospiza melodia maxima]
MIKLCSLPEHLQGPLADGEENQGSAVQWHQQNPSFDDSPLKAIVLQPLAPWTLPSNERGLTFFQPFGHIFHPFSMAAKIIPKSLKSNTSPVKTTTRMECAALKDIISVTEAAPISATHTIHGQGCDNHGELHSEIESEMLQLNSGWKLRHRNKSSYNSNKTGDSGLTGLLGVPPALGEEAPGRADPNRDLDLLFKGLLLKMGTRNKVMGEEGCKNYLDNQCLSLVCVLLSSAYGKVTRKGLTHNAKVGACQSCDELQLYRKRFQLAAAERKKAMEVEC